MSSDAVRRIMLPTSRQKRPIKAPPGSPQHNPLCNILSPSGDLRPRRCRAGPLHPRFRRGRLLADWVGQSARLVRPLVDALGAHVMAAERVHARACPRA